LTYAPPGRWDRLFRVIITIDGPAGSGKSTAARNIAKAMNIAYLDTGATYRAVALKALREGADMRNEAALAELARKADIRLEPAPEGLRVFLDGEDVSREIRTSKVTDNTRYVARPPAVREVLVALQRRIGAALGSFATEGRDQGSVVFPDADVKFYLVASPEARARRRFEEMQATAEEVEYEQVLERMLARDGGDRERSVAPLVRPEGAVEIDTSNNTIEQTTAEILRHLEGCRE